MVAAVLLPELLEQQVELAQEQVGGKQQHMQGYELVVGFAVVVGTFAVSHHTLS